MESKFILYRRPVTGGRDEPIGEYPASCRHRQVFGAGAVYKRTDELEAGDCVEGIGRLSRVSRLDAVAEVA